MTGAYATQLRGSHRYLLLHHTAAAAVTATLAPAAPGACLRFELRRWTGSWKTIYLTVCYAVNARGVVTLPLDLRRLTGATLRIRAEYAPGSDAADAADWGGWEYLAVRWQPGRAQAPGPVPGRRARLVIGS